MNLIPAHSEALSPEPRSCAFWENRLFLLLIVASLIPIWSARYFPSQDGPAHVENAAILRSFFGGWGVVRQFYQLSPTLIPNVLGHGLLAALLCVFPPNVSEKILVSAYVILLPLAGRYAIRSINPKGSWAAFLLFPLIYNRPFERGFYNFSIGLVLMFFVIGYWVANRERLSVWRLVSLMALSFLLYLSHLSTAVAAIGVIVFLALYSRQDRSSGVALKTFAALVPAMILCGWYTNVHPLAAPAKGGGMSLPEAVHDLAFLDVLVTHHAGEALLALGVSLLLFVITLIAILQKVKRRSIVRWDAFLVLIALFLTGYLRARDGSAIALYVPERLALFMVALLILWLASQHLPKRAQFAAAFIAGALTLGWIGLNTIKYRELSHCYEDYMAAAPMIARGETLLSLSYSTQGFDDQGAGISAYTAPLLHVAGYIAADRGAIDLANYEAAAAHFPIQFQKDMGPAAFGKIEPVRDRPPCADIGGWETKSGRKVDWVLLYWMRDSDAGHPCTQAIRAQLGFAYERVPLMSSRVELYRRRR